MIKEVNVRYSQQAEMILKEMPKLDKDKLGDWWINQISIGGADIINYLEWKSKVN